MAYTKITPIPYLEPNGEPEITENGTRTHKLLYGADESGTLSQALDDATGAALESVLTQYGIMPMLMNLIAGMSALDARVTALEEAQNTSDEEEPNSEETT